MKKIGWGALICVFFFTFASFVFAWQTGDDVYKVWQIDNRNEYIIRPGKLLEVRGDIAKIEWEDKTVAYLNIDSSIFPTRKDAENFIQELLKDTFEKMKK